MEVVCNNVPCCLEIKGSVVSCVPKDTTGGNTEVFVCSEISQLLRSRHNLGAVKIIIGDKSILLRFIDPREREHFIDKVRSIDSATDENEHWVASTICHAAVDVGLMDEKALDSLIKEEYQRGVVIAFDAISALVDPETFKIRPITEQLANDVLRQIPLLAKVFELCVTDEETRQHFWEAVVRKYFCFSRTFLEEELRELEQDVPPQLSSSGDILSINNDSGRALPKGKAQVLQHTLPQETEEPNGRRLYALLFDGAPSTRSWTHEVEAACPPPMHLATLCPPHISRTLPREGTNRDTLELLKRFWSSDMSQRKALRTKLKSTRDSGSSVVQQRCLQWARLAVDELIPERE